MTTPSNHNRKTITLLRSLILLQTIFCFVPQPPAAAQTPPPSNTKTSPTLNTHVTINDEVRAKLKQSGMSEAEYIRLEQERAGVDLSKRSADRYRAHLSEVQAEHPGPPENITIIPQPDFPHVLDRILTRDRRAIFNLGTELVLRNLDSSYSQY